MSLLNPSYPTREVAIALENAPDNVAGAERKKVGDIIVLRSPGVAIGTKEAKEYLWLRIEGLEENGFYQLENELYEPAVDPDTGIRYDKRRYCIPLDRLQTIYPSLNQSRALDLDDFYQPFILVDSEDYSFVTADEALQVNGLIFDKSIGNYI